MTLEDLLVKLLAEGREAKAFQAAAMGVVERGECLATAFVGGAGPESLWDLASLTKPMATATLALQAVSDGAFTLEQSPFEWAPHLTWEDLLSHRSGLEAWCDMGQWVALSEWGSASGRIEILKQLRARLRQATPHAEPVYSDLGYILLGEALAAQGYDLGTLRWSEPRGYGFLPPSSKRALCVPMGFCRWRQRELQGEVHDSNAWLLGGVSGHAGLFATLTAVLNWASQVERCAAGKDALTGLRPDILKAFWERPQPRQGTWVCGWDSPSVGTSSAGAGVSQKARGHLGFTGTSVWIEPELQRATVILSDRVALGEAAQAQMRLFRPHAHARIRAFQAGVREV